MERPRLLMNVKPLPNILHEPEPVEVISTGKMRIPGIIEKEFTAGTLKDLGPIGCGSFGTVSKMLYLDAEIEMAVKRIRCQNIPPKDQQRLLLEQSIIMNSSSPNIVQFYGVIFHEGDCWICMELMTISLDRLYRYVYDEKHEYLSVNIIGHIAISMIDALQYLKTHLKIMHRDVKPSNVLISDNGEVKLCDFGICGELKDSIVRTHDIGCQPYLSPERLTKQEAGYGVGSDVWSLGITILEITIGKFPYPEWTSPFEQLDFVVHGDPPVLPFSENRNYSVSLSNFINACLTKELQERPTYQELMTKEFYIQNTDCDGETRDQLVAYAREALDFASNM
ncbi:unnamed protein product [Auanema sp. JU1783]|nr:unnamed protein product [Auanema sp. JU1783]